MRGRKAERIRLKPHPLGRCTHLRPLSFIPMHHSLYRVVATPAIAAAAQRP